MLDYTEVKKFFAKKLIEDFEGVGRIESAAYHTIKMVYLKGVDDGKSENIGIIDGKKSFTSIDTYV